MEILEHNIFDVNYNEDYLSELRQIESDIHNIASSCCWINNKGKIKKRNWKDNLQLIETEPLIFTYNEPSGKTNIPVILNPYPIAMNKYQNKFSIKKGIIDSKTYKILREVEYYLKSRGIQGILCCVIKYDKESIKNIKSDFNGSKNAGLLLRENYYIRNSNEYFELMRKYTALELQYRKSINNIDKEVKLIMRSFPDFKKNMTVLNYKIINSKLDNLGIRKQSTPSSIIKLLPGLVRFRLANPNLKSPINEINRLNDEEIIAGKKETDYLYCKKHKLLKFLNKWISVWNFLHPENMIAGKVSSKNPNTASALFNKLDNSNINEFLNSIPQHIFYAKIEKKK